MTCFYVQAEVSISLQKVNNAFQSEDIHKNVTRCNLRSHGC